jgi:hypothetical protein
MNSPSFPPNCPGLEANPVVGRRLAECQRWVVRRFEESSPSWHRPCHPAPCVRSNRIPPTPDRFKARIGAFALSLGAAARSRWSGWGTAILTALPGPRNSYRIVNSSVRGAPALPRSLFSLRRSPTLGCRYQFTTETRRLHGGPTSSVDSVSPWRIFPQGQSIQQETHEQRGALPTSRRRTDKRGLRGLDRTAAGT